VNSCADFRATAVVAVWLMTTPATANAQISYSGSVTFAASEIDAQRVNATYWLNGIDISLGRFSTGITLPMIAQQVPLVGADGGLTGELSNATGLGDLTLWGAARLTNQQGPVRLVVSGSLKLPTGDADANLGSGKADGSVSVTIAIGRSRHQIVVDLSYWVIGDSVEAPARNVPAVYLGYGALLGADYRWTAIAGVSTARSMVEGLQPPTQLFFGVQRGVDRRAWIGMSAGIGLTETAPKFHVGMTWRVTF
jgi:hypothetical protein